MSEPVADKMSAELIEEIMHDAVVKEAPRVRESIDMGIMEDIVRTGYNEKLNTKAQILRMEPDWVESLPWTYPTILVGGRETTFKKVTSRKMSCTYCGKQGIDLSLCARCHKAPYCSKLCQKIDWGEKHKLLCQVFQ